MKFSRKTRVWTDGDQSLIYWLDQPEFKDFVGECATNHIEIGRVIWCREDGTLKYVSDCHGMANTMYRYKKTSMWAKNP